MKTGDFETTIADLDQRLSNLDERANTVEMNASENEYDLIRIRRDITDVEVKLSRVAEVLVAILDDFRAHADCPALSVLFDDD